MWISGVPKSVLHWLLPKKQKVEGKKIEKGEDRKEYTETATERRRLKDSERSIQKEQQKEGDRKEKTEREAYRRRQKGRERRR